MRTLLLVSALVGSAALSARPGGAVRKVVVIGGGWAGYTVADALSSSPDVSLTLLEARATSGGLAGGWRTSGGRPVEAGVHGFWREYRNTFAMMEAIGLDVDRVLTPYTPSVLVSRTGRVATAPVLGLAANAVPSTSAAGAVRDGGGSSVPALPLSPQQLISRFAQLLPAPLDTALLAEYAPGSRLTLADRASAIGLLPLWADFGQEDRMSWLRYDDVTAEDLFKRYGGVSERTYEDLVEPLLHVLPMGPGYDISAAAALSCFHVFALQARGAFDVRWCQGSIFDQIFAPWQQRLESRPNVRIRPGSKVTSVKRKGEDDGEVVTRGSKRGVDGCESTTVAGMTTDDAQNSTVPDSKSTRFADDAADESANTLDAQKKLLVYMSGCDAPLEADVVVLAVGATAGARLCAASSAIKALPTTQGFAGLRGITCVAVRLFLKPASYRTAGLSGGSFDSTLCPPEVALAMVASPVLVCGPGVGGLTELKETGFCVYDLQRMQQEFAEGELSVLEVDFYRADNVASLDDEGVLDVAIQAIVAALNVPLSVLPRSAVVDAAVVRARNAVSHFDPGSAKLSPPVVLGEGIYACGDWIDRTGHASWSTEKAVVTGKQAATAIANDFGLEMPAAEVIPAASDSQALAVLRSLARSLREKGGLTGVDDGLLPRAPWASLLRPRR